MELRRCRRRLVPFSPSFLFGSATPYPRPHLDGSIAYTVQYRSDVRLPSLRKDDDARCRRSRIVKHTARRGRLRQSLCLYCEDENSPSRKQCISRQRLHRPPNNLGSRHAAALKLGTAFVFRFGAARDMSMNAISHESLLMHVGTATAYVKAFVRREASCRVRGS